MFCVPHAGGLAAMYNCFGKFLDHSIELHPVELAGRGSRGAEPLHGDFSEMVNDVYDSIKSHLNTCNYALLGHSMGSWIVYELYHKIRQLNNISPLHIFFSGNRAPFIEKEEKVLHRLSSVKLIEEVMKLGGSSKEFIENTELLRLCVPVLRNDYRIVENYKFTKKNCDIDCNITVFNGVDDDITMEEMYGWKQLTAKECEIINFEGGHNFIKDSCQMVAYAINKILL